MLALSQRVIHELDTNFTGNHRGLAVNGQFNELSYSNEYTYTVPLSEVLDVESKMLCLCLLV